MQLLKKSWVVVDSLIDRIAAQIEHLSWAVDGVTLAEGARSQPLDGWAEIIAELQVTAEQADDRASEQHTRSTFLACPTMAPHHHPMVNLDLTSVD